jgi:type I restriction enzyme S subunit
MGEWKECTLAEVSEDISYGFTESASQDPIGPKFLRITDIANGRVDWNAVPYCPISDADRKKYQLIPGDIVIARTGASTGANYILSEADPKDVVYASYLIRYRIDGSLADPRFVLLLTGTKLEVLCGGCFRRFSTARCECEDLGRIRSAVT